MQHLKSPYSEQKPQYQGPLLAVFLVIWWLGLEQFWYKSIGYASMSAFQSSEIVYYCSAMEIRWFSTSPSPQVLRSIANL